MESLYIPRDKPPTLREVRTQARQLVDVIENAARNKCYVDLPENATLADELAYSMAANRILSKKQSHLWKALSPAQRKIMELTMSEGVFYKNNLIYFISEDVGVTKDYVRRVAIPELGYGGWKFIGELSSESWMVDNIIGRGPCIQFARLRNQLNAYRIRGKKDEQGSLYLCEGSSDILQTAFIEGMPIKYNITKSNEPAEAFFNLALAEGLITLSKQSEDAYEFELTELGQWFVSNTSACKIPELFGKWKENWKEILGCKVDLERMILAVERFSATPKDKQRFRKIRTEIWDCAEAFFNKKKDMPADRDAKADVDYTLHMYDGIDCECTLEYLKALQLAGLEEKLNEFSITNEVMNELDERMRFKYIPDTFNDLMWLFENLSININKLKENLVNWESDPQLKLFAKQFKEARKARRAGNVSDAIKIYKQMGWDARAEYVT